MLHRDAYGRRGPGGREGDYGQVLIPRLPVRESPDPSLAFHFVAVGLRYMSAAKSLARLILSDTGFFAVAVESLMGVLLCLDYQGGEDEAHHPAAEHDPAEYQYTPLC